MRLWIESLLMLSAQAGVVAVMVWGVIALAGRWLSAGGRYALWFLVAVRMVVPAPASRFSLYNLILPAAHEETQPAPAMQVTYSAGTPTPGPVAPMARVVEEARPMRFGFWDVVAVMWIAGAVVCAGIFVASIARFARRIREDRLVTDEAVLALLAECAGRMRVRRKVEIRETSAVLSPALAGVFRPTLLLPAGALSQLSREELRFVILHELAHLKHHDIAVDRVLSVLQCVHWFNPAIYWAFSRLRAERELLRDAAVLGICGQDERLQYGRTLLHLARQGSAGLVTGAVGIVEPKAHLRRRIDAIAEPRSGGVWRWIASLLLVAVVLAAPLRSRESVVMAQTAAAQEVVEKRYDLRIVMLLKEQTIFSALEKP